MKAWPAAIAILSVISQLPAQARAQSHIIVTAERAEDKSACDWEKFIETAQETTLFFQVEIMRIAPAS